MAGGFSFCDTDIATIGLTYVPELEDTFVYKPADSQSHIETFEGHSGGYYYGSWYSPKEFTLRCYFENSRIDKGVMSKVYALFKTGKSGKLVFDRRPWCYYYATVTDPIELDLKNYENGVITIKMKAMYPYARSDIIVNTRSERYHDSLMDNTAVFDKPEMDKYRIIENLSLSNNNPYHLTLANPGQEPAALGVAIAGDVGGGIIIANRTTGQSMKLVAINDTITPSGKEIIVDPISGKTVISGNGETKLAVMHHEYGFLSLAPSFPAVRNIYITYNNSNIVTVLNVLNQDIVGKYIFIAGDWVKIVEQIDRHTIKIEQSVHTASSERTMVIPMNEIYITAVTTINLRSLKFIFKPTYA